MSEDVPVRLVLEECVEVYVDESGEERPLNLDLDPERSRAIVSALSDAFGEPERDRKTTRPTVVKGHSFGGHDVLLTVTQAAFVLGGASVAKAAFASLRAWLDLRKSRSVSLEIGSGKTKRKVSLKAMDFDDLPLKIQELILATDPKDAKAPAKKAARKVAATKPASAKSRARRPADE